MKLDNRSFITENTLFLKRIKDNPFYIGDIPVQTEELCIEAIKGDWFTFRFILNQTPRVCLFALKESGGYALQFIRNQTLELCEEAIQQGILMDSDIADIIHDIRNINIRNNFIYQFLK